MNKVMVAGITGAMLSIAATLYWLRADDSPAMAGAATVVVSGDAREVSGAVMSEKVQPLLTPMHVMKPLPVDHDQVAWHAPVGCMQRSCVSTASGQTPTSAALDLAIPPEALSQQDPAWIKRVQDWVVQRDAIRHDQHLDESAREARILQLRSEQFGPEEQAKLEAIERTHGPH